MAFTLHWSNTYCQRYPLNSLAYHNRIEKKLYYDRVCPTTPVLSIQADVIYPNADSAISREQDPDQHCAGPPPGCLGHQLDNSFPMESRTPVPLPLIMYPAGTEEIDTCAFPVLQWEKYCQDLRGSSITRIKSFFLSLASKSKDKREVLRKRRLAVCEALERKPDSTILNPSKSSSLESPLPWTHHRTRPKRISYTDTRRAVLQLQVSQDIEQDEQELKTEKPIKVKRKTKLEQRAQVKRKKETLKNLPLPIPKVGMNRQKLPPRTTQKFINVPKPKLQSTWNYLYNGTGACSWLQDTNSRQVKHLFVGNGAKLRMISLKESNPAQMLSYTVEDVWEEDQIPSNVHLGIEDLNDFFNSQVLQIKTLKKRSHLGVRRGKSIDIYVIGDESMPSLLASIPNVGYGGTKYLGVNKRSAKPNPLLTSFDLNRSFPAELVMIDENAIVQFIDIISGRVTSQVKGMRPAVAAINVSSVGPKNALKDSTGVSYIGDNPQVIYYWVESSIHFYDARADDTNKSRELFNLRESISTRSFSDKEYFRSKDSLLNEYISTFVPSSAQPHHYYFGTTQRIFMMDIRVPKNPVFKVSHGLASPPAYMDLLSGDSFDVLVAGSQRSSETFCAFIDRGHLACIERVDCQQQNPILHSYPGHLSNPREFHDFVLEQDLSSVLENDFERAKRHCDAWTTGLCLMLPSKPPVNPGLPSSFILFNGNAFGDVFVQEWDQKPVKQTRQVLSTDNRLRSFLHQWRESMETPLETSPSLPKPAVYGNFTLLMESAHDRLKRGDNKRSMPFDPFTPHAVTYHRVRGGLPSLHEQIDALNPSDQDVRGQKFLQHWRVTRNVDEEILGNVHLQLVQHTIESAQVKVEVEDNGEYFSDLGEL